MDVKKYEADVAEAWEIALRITHKLFSQEPINENVLLIIFKDLLQSV